MFADFVQYTQTNCKCMAHGHKQVFLWFSLVSELLFSPLWRIRKMNVSEICKSRPLKVLACLRRQLNSNRPTHHVYNLIEILFLNIRLISKTLSKLACKLKNTTETINNSGQPVFIWPEMHQAKSDIFLRPLRFVSR